MNSVLLILRSVKIIFHLELVYCIITPSFVSFQNVKKTSSFPKFDRGWIELNIVMLSYSLPG